MRWTLEQVAQALGVAPPAGVEPVARVAGVSIDSRTLQRGELFVAIHGPRHDGHTFVAAALAGGAPAAVVAQARVAEFPAEIRGRLLHVADTLGALQGLSRAVRRGWAKADRGHRMAAVTGSPSRSIRSWRRSSTAPMDARNVWRRPSRSSSVNSFIPASVPMSTICPSLNFRRWAIQAAAHRTPLPESSENLPSALNNRVRAPSLFSARTIMPSAPTPL